MPSLYFAYGNNMSSESIGELCPLAAPIGPAVLHDHRLAFTRQSRKCDGGVADVIPAVGMCVWGVLYNITKQCQVALDLSEGNGTRYIRQMIQVQTVDGTVQEAIAHKVIDPVFPELTPTEQYIYMVHEGAVAHKLPDDYIEFIRGLWKLRSIPGPYRGGLRVVGYVAGYALHVHPADIPADVRQVRVQYTDTEQLIAVLNDRKLAPGTCRVGDEVRERLRLPRGLYGATIQTRRA